MNNALLNTFSVPSGEFVVSTGSDQLLKAYLGTCVGVVLFDDEKRVGGLYHILLAEPPDKNNTWEETRYASMGMPLFINKLEEQGARVTHLKAVIAGGGLVGPISEQDLSLDIGGQTVETVKNILKEKAIPVVYSETGGYFSCSVSINLNNWEWKIEPIGMKIQGEIHTPAKLSAEEIDAHISRVRPIPQVLLKVVRMLHNEKTSMRDIANEIRQDQVLSAKIIKFINSSFMGISREISAIDQALLMMGEHKLVLLALSVVSELLFKDYEQGYSLCKGGLYYHALGTAHVAEKIAALTGTVPTDIAYTAGLLHDIGKLVLDQFIARDYPYFYRQMNSKNITVKEIEEDSFGISHTEAGYRLARLWTLPEDLQEVIAWHHEPEKAKVNETLTHLIYLADLLMSGFRAGYEIERMDNRQLKIRLEKLNLKPSHLPSIIDYIPWKNLESLFLT